MQGFVVATAVAEFKIPSTEASVNRKMLFENSSPKRMATNDFRTASVRITFFLTQGILVCTVSAGRDVGGGWTIGSDVGGPITPLNLALRSPMRDQG